MIKPICEKFLSFLQDHYKKNSFWRNSSLEHYEKVFANVPAKFLRNCFDLYCQNHMPQFLPTLAQIQEFVKAQSGCKDSWFHSEKNLYCKHCRSDEHGLEGSYRVVTAQFYSPKKQKEVNLTLSARCTDENCEAYKGSGRTYLEIIRDIMSVDSKALIRYDHWHTADCKHCSSTSTKEGRVRATYQGNDMWKHRIKNGYVEIKEQDGQRYYHPIWEHPIWATSMGRVMAKEIGWERPESVLRAERKKKSKRARNSGYGSTKKALTDSAIDKMFGPYGW